MSNMEVIVRLPKQILVLRPMEILKLLQNNPELHATALRRGKYYKRREALDNRKGRGRHGDTHF